MLIADFLLFRTQTFVHFFSSEARRRKESRGQNALFSFAAAAPGKSAVNA
jgi:hypothetical protein